MFAHKSTVPDRKEWQVSSTFIALPYDQGPTKQILSGAPYRLIPHVKARDRFDS